MSRWGKAGACGLVQGARRPRGQPFCTDEALRKLSFGNLFFSRKKKVNHAPPAQGMALRRESGGNRDSTGRNGPRGDADRKGGQDADSCESVGVRLATEAQKSAKQTMVIPKGCGV